MDGRMLLLIKEFRRNLKKTNAIFSTFNYKEFVNSAFDTYFIPLAVPLYTTRWRGFERSNGIVSFTATFAGLHLRTILVYYNYKY